MELCDTTLLNTELEGVMEGAIFNAIRPGSSDTQISPGIDCLLCCGALLGTSVLQVHALPHVRQLAVEALQQLGAQRRVFAATKQVLGKILHPQHLCLEDL